MTKEVKEEILREKRNSVKGELLIEQKTEEMLQVDVVNHKVIIP